MSKETVAVIKTSESRNPVSISSLEQDDCVTCVFKNL